jgi:hypothetical protein
LILRYIYSIIIAPEYTNPVAIIALNAIDAIVFNIVISALIKITQCTASAYNAQQNKYTTIKINIIPTVLFII